MPDDDSNGTEGRPYRRQSEFLVARTNVFVIWAIFGLIVMFLIWSGSTELEKVTRAPGRVVPHLQNQMVQHFEGGIVAEILVKEGDTVKRGQPLLRIENRQWRSELQQAQIELNAKRIRLSRLDAESRASRELELPADLPADAKEMAGREHQLLLNHISVLTEQTSIVEEQVRQKELERQELDARWISTVREREFAAERLKNLQQLQTIGAVSGNEILENQRVLQQTDTRLSDLSHELPRVAAALAELNRRRSEIRLRFQGDAEKDRVATEIDLAKLNEQLATLRERSARSEVTASVDAIVNKLNVTTVGGVVRSGEPLLQLVPLEAKVMIEARLAPIDRADVWPGLPAVIKVSAYDYTRFGGLPSKVIDISPDALQDEKGVPYFRIRLEADTSNFGQSHPVVPGMTADVDIISGRRTVLASLLRPVRLIEERAFRQ
jgi:HlyD family type I secretion membrane fusion protein